jgi:hypothetical protein
MLKLNSILNLSFILSALTLTFSLPVMAKDVMPMNRIGPSNSELYLAIADSTGEHKLLSTAGFDCHASYPYLWVVSASG